MQFFSRDREALQIIYVDATQGWVITSVADQGGSQTTYILLQVEQRNNIRRLIKFIQGLQAEHLPVSSVGNAMEAAVSYMVIAGGGGGGATQPSNRGGGGGAGG